MFYFFFMDRYVRKVGSKAVVVIYIHHAYMMRDCVLYESDVKKN